MMHAESNGKDSLLRLPNTKMSHMHPHGISNNPAESIEWQHVEIAAWGNQVLRVFMVMTKMKKDTWGAAVLLPSYPLALLDGTNGGSRCCLRATEFCLIRFET